MSTRAATGLVLLTYLNFRLLHFTEQVERLQDGFGSIHIFRRVSFEHHKQDGKGGLSDILTARMFRLYCRHVRAWRR